MKKKIIFINPPNDIEKHNNFTIGLFSLATVLKNEGYKVRIIDFDYLINRNIVEQTNCILYL